MKSLVVAALILLVAGCRTHKAPPAPISLEGTNVHVLIPCATLTPFADYRDFMDPGSVLYGDFILKGHPTGEPFPTMPAFEGAPPQILPPTQATLVFDNLEGCE